MLRQGSAVFGLAVISAGFLLIRTGNCVNIQCAIYIMDKPGQGLGKIYVGKDLQQPAIDCENPDLEVVKKVCGAWFGKVNQHWSLMSASRTRGDPFVIADDLCGLLNTEGKWTFGAFHKYCDVEKMTYSGHERADSTLCCKGDDKC